MRIISGEYRGRILKTPKGINTRPTTDRVRESLMSAISSARGSFEDAIVLDAFAGSGALGFEALSRGAEKVTFYEKDEAAIRILRANAVSLELTKAKLKIYHTNILKHPPRYADKPFDLVFLDPPYLLEPTVVVTMLKDVMRAGVLAKHVLISYEHLKSFDSAAKEAFNSLQWEPVFRKSYGDTSIDIVRCK